MAELEQEVETDAPVDVHDDIKSDIREAMDKLSGDDTEAAPVEAKEAPRDDETPQARTERLRDEKGRFQPKEAAQETAPPKGRTRQSAPAELEAPEAKPKVQVKADPVENLPAAFKPTMLEAWKTLPREAKEEIHRWESETKAVIAQTKAVRDFAQQIQEAVAPYQAILQAEGGSPATSLRNYLQAATLMRQGSPLAKAQWIAKLTRTFTSQEHLGLLDQAVAAEFGINGTQAPTAEPQGYQPQAQQFRDPRVDELLARQQQAQQLEWQRGYESAQQDYQQWTVEKSPEFLPWVRNKMATLLETAARDNEELGFDEAYDAACRTHPEVRKILLQREEAARAQPSAVQRSRRAAVSLRPQGAVASTGGNGANSIRDDVSEAWDAIMGR